MGILAPLVGVLVDRWGARQLMLGGTILLGLGMILVGRTTSLGMFYIAFTLIAFGISGLISTVPITAVANWFRKKVGTAIGIVSSGVGAGGLLIPVVVNLIDMLGWRMAISVLGVGIWIIGLPLSLIVRHRPEQYGYLPDGEQSDTTTFYEGPAPVPTAEVDIGVKEALTGRTFWQMTLAMTFPFIVVSAVIVHVMPYLNSIGVARSTSSLVATAIPVVSIGGRLGSGWLGDRFDKKLVAGGSFAMICVGLLLFNYVSSMGAWLLVPFIIVFGIGYGGSPALRAALVREYFGRNNMGTIYGSMMGMMALGGIIGPVLAGWIYDSWGSYNAAWLLFVCITLVSIIVMVTTPRLHAKV